MTDSLIFRQLVQETLALGELPDPGARFVADLGCDSLDLVDLIMATEFEFAITITDEEGQRLTTVQDAIDFIGARLAESHDSSQAASVN